MKCLNKSRFTLIMKISLLPSFPAIIIISVFFLVPFDGSCQGYVVKSIKDFGAKGNGRSNDQQAFVKASAFFNQRKGNGKLVIPKGVYITGRQAFLGNDPSGIVTYLGENVIDLRNCSNMLIEGKPGSVIKNADSLRIGTFMPATGKPFKHTMKDINVQPAYAKYAANAGNVFFLSACSNIKISGLIIDGNVSNFILGGNWGTGRNAYELIHYGINILDSHDIGVSDCNIKNFSCDGIYIANMGQERKTYKITIDKCKVNYCGRNGLSWIGGEDIRVTNSVFSNQGRGLVQESPGAGISIEVENSSFCRKGYFYNCVSENNSGSAITSGSKSLASDVVFKKCTAASPGYYTVFADAAKHRFEDCSFFGTVLVWYRAAGDDDAVQFKRCLFEERFKGKKMYDGSYQLGVEATATIIDSCLFRAYTTASYYLNGLTKDCSVTNPQKVKVSNCLFYNYSNSGSQLGDKIAGIANHTVFYYNKFYTVPAFRFINGFELACNADAGNNIFLPIQK